jgi:hypothetical protein
VRPDPNRRNNGGVDFFFGAPRPRVAAAAPAEADSDDDDDNYNYNESNGNNSNSNGNGNAIVSLLEDDPGDDALFTNPLSPPPIKPVADTRPAHPNAVQLFTKPEHKEVRIFFYSCVIEPSIRGRSRVFSNTHTLFLFLPCVAPQSLVRRPGEYRSFAVHRGRYKGPNQRMDAFCDGIPRYDVGIRRRVLEKCRIGFDDWQRC